MEQSPRRRAHTKVGPRRAGVQFMPLQKAPPRRKRSQIRPQNSFAYSSSQKASPGGEPYRLCAPQNQRPAARRPQIRPAKKSPSNSGKALFVILVYSCHAFTWRRSQSHQASTPSPVRAQMGKISSFGLRIRAYSVTLSISKSKYGSTST